MRESEPWKPNILPLLCRIEPQSKAQKFQDSLALPFKQVLPSAVIQQVLEEQGVSYRGYDVHAHRGSVSMDVTSPRLG